MNINDSLEIVKRSFEMAGKNTLPAKEYAHILAVFIACASAEMSMIGESQGALDSLNAAAKCVRSFESSNMKDKPCSTH
jgi:hypothetical protein